MSEAKGEKYEYFITNIFCFTDSSNNNINCITENFKMSFAIFLVITFIIGDLVFLVATIAYTILAFITAVITNIICRLLNELDDREGRRCCRKKERCGCCDKDNNTQLLSINGRCSNNNDNLLTISSNGCNGIENELLTINTSCRNHNNNCNCNCECSSDDSGHCNCNTSNDSIAVRASVFPNCNTNGRTGSFCGCFRRR